MILLTFLGLPRQGQYENATYQFGDRACTTRFFPAAVPRLVDGITQVRVFLTQGARQGWAPLKAEFDAVGVQALPVDIPDGRSPDELWAIFEKLVSDVPAGAKVVFDVTHGFRSLPLFSALAVALLKSAREIEVHGILYGAFDAKRPDGIVPVFDLGVMANLLDWIAAVERFRHHLDGTPLRDLLEAIQNQANRQSAAEAPKSLRSVGKRLGSLTDALLLGRIREVLRETPGLCHALDDPKFLQEARHWAKPLALVLEPIQQLLDQIGRASEFDLAAHYRLAQLYAQRRLYMPAITVLREWVVSRACRLAGFTDAELTDETRRREVEHQLNVRCREKTDAGRSPSEPPPESPPWLSNPAAEEICKLWSRLPHIRNDVDHAGMRQQDLAASNLIKNIQSLVERGALSPELPNCPAVTLDVSTLYAATGTARLADLPAYEQAAKAAVPPGADVTLTGPGPVWLYLKIAHALHGRARRLMYDSPVTGGVLVFDHSPA